MGRPKGFVSPFKGKKRPELSGENHYMYGKHPTEETKKKSSESHKKWLETHPHQRGMLGKKQSEETKRKHIEFMKEWHRTHKSKGSTGKHWKMPEEGKLKDSLSKKKWYETHEHPRLGKKHTPETLKRLSIAQKKRFEKIENHPRWQGGISFEPYSLDWTKTLRKSIRERDHYICQICSAEGIDVHHIDYNKKNCNPDNLITLCHKCHMKTNTNRNTWIIYLKK